MKIFLTSKKLLASVLSLSSLFIISCGSSNDENTISVASQVSNVSAQSVDNPVISSEFISALKKQNISLSSEDKEKLSRLIKVQPTGEWTPGPENNSKENLTKHFIKHGKDFKPAYKTEEDYLEGAMKASKNQCDDCSSYFDTKYYKDEKMVSVVRWNSKTLDFSVTRENGQIATYFVNKVKQPRFILIPKESK